MRARISDTPIKKYEYVIKQYEYQNFHSDARNKKYDWQIFHSASRINKSCQSKNQPTDSNGLMYASWLSGNFRQMGSFTPMMLFLNCMGDSNSLDK